MSTITISEGRLNYFRSMLGLGFIFFPLWALILDFKFYSLRLHFGMIAGWIIVLSFRSMWVRRNLRDIVYGLLYLCTILLNYKFIGQGLQPLWAIYHAVVFIGIGLVFRDFKYLVIYVLLFLTCTWIATMLIEDPVVDKWKFLILFTSASFVILINATAHWWSIRKIEQFQFANAHELRAPLARILGIINIYEALPPEELKELLSKEAKDLDKVVQELQEKLE